MQTPAPLVVASWLFLLVVSHGAAASAEETQKDAVTHFRLRGQNLHVDYIAAQLDKLESELSQWTEPSAENVAQTKSRIGRLEKPKCQPNELLCSGDAPQCVSHLLVCDGIKDCDNGQDESEATCDGSLIKPGSSFFGVAKSGQGLILFNRPLALTIQTVKRSPVFKAQAFVKGLLTAEYQGEVFSGSFNGRFVYATRQLELSFVDLIGNHIVIECALYQANDDRLNCKTYTAGARVKLSSFTLQRV